MYNEKYHRTNDPDYWEVNRNNYYLNCGSFALDIPELFCLYDEDYDEYELVCDYENFLWSGLSVDEAMDIALERDWDIVLSKCPWLASIELEDAADDDRVIAYRIGWIVDEEHQYGPCIEDADFHFRVRLGGQWYEKCGSGPVHLCKDQDIFSPWTNGDLTYSSQIRFARFKN